MSPLATIYGAAARLRRSWYARDPRRARRLSRPVISVGNLRVGGSGKTPVVAAIARLLLEAGERPAILSRGYGRRSQEPVLVVSDGTRVLVPVDASGDEPQMLARALPGVPVVVARERVHAGLKAEGELGATVHILDDGFQHFQLARDVDLLLTSPEDLDDAVLPAGRLREPLATAAVADALLVPDLAAAGPLRAALSLLGAPADGRTTPPAFGMTPHLGNLRTVSGHAVTPSPGGRVVAVAGIARPERFVRSLRDAGLDVATTLLFKDHHWYGAEDLAGIARAMQQHDAAAVVTTEKDAARLAPLLTSAGLAADEAHAASWLYLPLTVTIDPADAFRSWLLERLAAARTRTGAGDEAA